MTQIEESHSRKQVARAVCADFADRSEALIEILHQVQNELTCIPTDVIPVIAEALNLSQADVHGVISFYHDFRQMPGGQHTIGICRAEACQALRGEELAAHAEKKLGIRFGGITADGRIGLRMVYCLGNCALAPAVAVDGKMRGRMDADRFDDLVANLSGESIHD